MLSAVKHSSKYQCPSWSVSNPFKWNIQSLAKYPKINYTGISSNNMAKFILYQILANILILKLKYNENISVILAIDILFMVMQSTIFVWHPGPYNLLEYNL